MSNKQAIDEWTFVHAIAGVIAGYFEIPYYLAIAIGWEMLEQGILAQTILPNWREPLDNIIVDVIVGYVGNKLGKEIKDVLE